MLRVVAGLGNPGQRYEKTRHNCGFRVLDRLYDYCRSHGRVSPWKEQKDAHTADVVLAGNKLSLIKPQRFMNISGRPLADYLSFYKIPAASLLVVHDDLDLPLGSMRIKAGGGHGGHNGIRSISADIGSPDYIRLKIGIGRPPGTAPGAGEDDERITGWVLGGFSAEEGTEIDRVFDQAIAAIDELNVRGLKSAQNRFNTKKGEITQS